MVRLWGALGDLSGAMIVTALTIDHKGRERRIKETDASSQTMVEASTSSGR